MPKALTKITHGDAEGNTFHFEEGDEVDLPGEVLADLLADGAIELNEGEYDDSEDDDAEELSDEDAAALDALSAEELEALVNLTDEERAALSATQE